MIPREWEGMGTTIVIPAHLYYTHGVIEYGFNSFIEIQNNRPPDVGTSKPLINAAGIFFTELLYSRPRNGRPSNECQGLRRMVNSNLPLGNFAQPSPDLYTWSKREKFGLDFRHNSSLSRPHFETKQHIGTKVSHPVHR